MAVISQAHIMKKLVWLFSAALVFGGCSSERSISVDGPIPSVVGVDDSAAIDETEAQAEEQQPVAGNAAANTAQPKPWSQPTPTTPTPSQTKYPVATPVAGKSGVVRSPYAPYAGNVDVSGFSPGQQVKCPYTGKIFIVP